MKAAKKIKELEMTITDIDEGILQNFILTNDFIIENVKYVETKQDGSISKAGISGNVFRAFKARQTMQRYLDSKGIAHPNVKYVSVQQLIEAENKHRHTS